METDDWLEAGRGMAFQNSNFRVYLPPGHFIKSWNYTDSKAIRAINWYIASCTALGKQPTLKAFFHLFNTKTSFAKPFVELPFVNKNSVIRKALGDYMAFDFPNSMTEWQYEFMVISGGELPWMPNMVLKVEKCYHAPREIPG